MDIPCRVTAETNDYYATLDLVEDEYEQWFAENGAVVAKKLSDEITEPDENGLTSTLFKELVTGEHVHGYETYDLFEGRPEKLTADQRQARKLLNAFADVMFGWSVHDLEIPHPSDDQARAVGRAVLIYIENQFGTLLDERVEKVRDFD